ncbi:MAG TPA: adenylate/guanylate cyclase domain-containing protein [Actinocrinis sp.]|uniref:AAA family ATPase n=1 Tax=Actinocrinis sp. TaxID=1920516 RepID=UPI002DDC9B50|nr:adenylate/guanylate cyclase domain-containing protein [Actinocrinis sp.]HEV2344265.1 adenylate/guanylate cyclase domain-containing protein [Actinocrinis sp.]
MPRRCPSCSAEQADSARFCSACGTDVGVVAGTVAAAAAGAGPAAARSWIRKIVTVLFCDLVDSTALGGRLDAETMRTLMMRYYAAMRQCVERHGGHVEKFVGDAVMAVFGVPAVHEDDALRAVRAALEMHREVAALNERLGDRLTLPLGVRIGINAGEVVATVDDLDADNLVAGDVVNIAARLEQAASSGQTVIGESVHRLTRESVVAEALDPIAAKGVDRPLAAWRVLSLAVAAAPARRTGFHGRGLELAALRNCLARASSHRTFQLCTVYGEAGMGKTRLAEQLLATVSTAEARVAMAACPAYGTDGSTLLPMVTAIRRTAEDLGWDPAELLPGHLVEGAVGDLPAETFAAIRRGLDALCRDTAVLLVLDDLHWADDPLLDLLDSLAQRMKNSPLMVLCLARIDLLERRPDWGGGKFSAVSLTLTPFAPDECESLGRELVRNASFDQRVLARCVEASMGNPFFLEQFLQMESERRSDDEFPLTVQSAVAARLDRLSRRQRDVLEWACVIGHEFGTATLERCCGEAAGLAAALDELDDKLLIRRTTDGDYEFCGKQVYDICYAAMPKAERAHRHRALGDIYGGQDARPGLAGHHYRSALLYWNEVFYDGDEVDEVRRDAGMSFLRSGRSALAVEDLPRAESALRRSVELLRLADGGPALEAKSLLMDTAGALGDGGAALALADELVAEAERAGNERFARYGRMERMALSPGVGPAQLEELARRVERICEREQDAAGSVRAWTRLGQAADRQGRHAEAAGHFGRVVEFARRSPGVLGLLTVLGGLASALRSGTEDCATAIESCESLLDEFGAARAGVWAAVGPPLAELLAMRGRFAEAHRRINGAIEAVDDLGFPEPRAAMEMFQTGIALLERDAAAALDHLEQARDRYARLGVHSPLWLAAQSARILLEAGLVDQAAETISPLLAAEPAPVASGASATSGGAPATASQVSALSLHARILAAQARPAEAVAASARAEELMAGVESPILRATVHLDSALIAAGIGDRDTAGLKSRQAQELFERKGHLVGARWAQRLREEGRL